MPLAKANIIGEPYGFIKIVADKKYGEILGIHIIGPKATELVASSLALLAGEFTVDELINTMYPHPTLNEAFPEAARAVYGQGAERLAAAGDGYRPICWLSSSEKAASRA